MGAGNIVGGELKAYRGTLRELAPDTDSVTRTYSARITVHDADARELMLGMTASVLAADIDGERAIRLPLTAIHDQAGQPVVWIVDGASAQVKPQPVTLGSAQDDSVLVASGLQGGETVVTAGVHLLYAGQKVKAVRAGEAVATAR